jgi:hypothetical protein
MERRKYVVSRMVMKVRSPPPEGPSFQTLKCRFAPSGVSHLTTVRPLSTHDRGPWETVGGDRCIAFR